MESATSSDTRFYNALGRQTLSDCISSGHQKYVKLRGTPRICKLMKHFEFWPPRLFEAPYYAALAWGCLRNGLPPRNLAKANYALDHGELGLGSKFSTQLAFDQSYFPATELLTTKAPEGSDTKKAGQSTEEAWTNQITEFAHTHGFPVIVKPDIGAVGKGVQMVSSQEEIEAVVASLQVDQLLQEYCPQPCEFGVFYVRESGKGRISGINKKHFPTVIGDGEHTLQQLAEEHPRYTQHWSIFLNHNDLTRVPNKAEEVRLSFIGSHTMGCKFTDSTDLQTPELEEALNAMCDAQPGFNFGRLDVRTASESALQRGEFVVIEVNGIASLPTHMFDPENRLRDAYRIFLKHAQLLVDIACEHRTREMQIDSYRDLWARARSNALALDAQHNRAKQVTTGLANQAAK